MRVAIIGASGLVGSHLAEVAPLHAHEPIPTSHLQDVPGFHRLDLRDEAATGRFLDIHAPGIVLLPAFQAAVDWVEEHPVEARELNITASQSLVRQLAARSIPLVYFSTDYVFDGTHGPYCETDPPAPIQEYGRQKLEMELYIQRNLPGALILRITWVIGCERLRKNFLYRALDAFRRGDRIRVPGDQLGNPTHALDIADATFRMIALRMSGIWHIAGPTRCSRAGFARAVARLYGFPQSLVDEVPTSALGQRAPRPLDNGLVIDKARTRADILLPDMETALHILARRLDVSP